MDLAYFAKVLAALFAIMSPVANLPVFMSLTADRDTAGQRNVAVTVILGLLIGLAITVFAGSAILKIFGIGIDAFRLAGGLLILFIALSPLHGQDPPPHAGSTKEKESFHDQNNPGIYPMTVPILLGPGAISSIIIFHEQTKTLAMKIAFGAAIVAMVVILGVTFFAAVPLARSRANGHHDSEPLDGDASGRDRHADDGRKPEEPAAGPRLTRSGNLGSRCSCSPWPIGRFPGMHFLLLSRPRVRHHQGELGL